MTNRNALFLSIRPRFAAQIFAGTKTVELRRVRTRIEEGGLVIVYASGDTKALLGAFQAEKVVASTPSAIWRRYGNKTGLTKREFDGYYSGSDTAFAIEIAYAWQLAVPVCLHTLRKKREGFRPPQSYHYLDTDTVLDIGGSALLGEKSRRSPRSAASPSPRKSYKSPRGMAARMITFELGCAKE